jgi:hypothetical protein
MTRCVVSSPEICQWVAKLAAVRHNGGLMARRNPPPRQEFSAEDTATALSMFNKSITSSRDEEKQRQALGRADRRRKDAGARVKRLMAGEGSPEDRAEAEAEYSDAVAEWQRINSGEEAPATEGPVFEDAPAATETSDDDAPAADTPAEENPAEQA